MDPSLIPSLVPLINPSLSGDKVILPSSFLQVSSDILTFKLTLGSISITCCSLEFGDTFQVSRFIWDHLHCYDGCSVLVERTALQKASFMALVCLDPLPSVDIRSLLESFIRRTFTTLALDAILKVPVGNSLLRFRIARLEPSHNVLVIDTDLELAIEQASMLELVFIGNRLDLSGSSSEALDYSFTSNRFLEFHFSPSIGDADIFISDIVDHPSALYHSFFNVGLGERTFVCKSNGPCHLSVVPFNGKCDFKMTVFEKEQPALAKNSGPLKTGGESAGASIPDGKECPNCHASIPSASFVMHEAFCYRNNTFCKQCKQIFKKTEFQNHYHCAMCSFHGHIKEKEKHEHWYHTVFKCDCGETVYLENVVHHRQECVERFIICRYCHLLVRAGPYSKLAKDLLIGKLTEHESECGARTIACAKCSKQVQLKDVPQHASYHEWERKSKPKPVICCNKQCCMLVGTAQNSLKMCASCFAPFWSPRLDQGNQNLLRKIVEKYHMQLTVGCGDAMCDNKYCATSTKQPMDPNDSAVESMRLLKATALFHSNPECHFCVSDGTRNKRIQAARLAEMGHDIAWAMQALSQTQFDSNAAATWLLNNAP